MLQAHALSWCELVQAGASCERLQERTAGAVCGIEALAGAPHFARALSAAASTASRYAGGLSSTIALGTTRSST